MFTFTTRTTIKLRNFNPFFGNQFNVYYSCLKLYGKVVLIRPSTVGIGIFPMRSTGYLACDFLKRKINPETLINIHFRWSQGTESNKITHISTPFQFFLPYLSAQSKKFFLSGIFKPFMALLIVWKIIYIPNSKSNWLSFAYEYRKDLV